MTQVSLIDSFWLMLAFYVIHIIDESLLGGSFVEKVKQHWWPQYSWRKFFWFNAGYLSVMFWLAVGSCAGLASNQPLRTTLRCKAQPQCQLDSERGTELLVSAARLQCSSLLPAGLMNNY